MRSHVSLLILLSLLLSTQSVSTARKLKKLFTSREGCILNAKEDFARLHSPVLLHPEDNKPYVAEFGGWGKSIIKLETGQKIKMACPGKKNVINDTQSQSLEFTCIGGKDLSMGGEETIDSKDIFCLGPVEYMTKPTDEPCAGEKGVSVNIGFEVDGDHKTIYTACYNESTKLTYYTSHVIVGSTIAGKATHINAYDHHDYRVGQIHIPSAAVSNVYDIYDADQLYAALTRAGGVGILTNRRYLGELQFIMPVQLTPVEDLVFAYQQRSTYFFVNTAPIWKSVGYGSLLKVEEALRKVAKEVMLGVERRPEK